MLYCPCRKNLSVVFSATLLTLFSLFVLNGCVEQHPRKKKSSRFKNLPDSAFLISGDDGGVWVYIKFMHPHLNNAYLEIFSRITSEKIDSGDFFAVCPVSEASKLLDPHNQFSSFRNDTLWFKSESGKEVCFMMKRK